MAIKQIWPLAMVLLLSACTGNLVYDKNLTMPDKQWHWQQRGEFEVAVDDTTATYDLLINTRINRNYPFANMWIMMQERTPDGDSSLIRLELPLFAPDGQPLGVSKGTVFEYRIPVQKSKTYARSGLYKYSVEQNMRINTLPGVLDVGIALEKTGEKF
ncbi:MAG: gliding motility lipoprotein GldH [Bacteroidetes bacterium]|nr:MAG: gliding motility lipoprotein GldH [Bacteroidota bacterium]